MPRSRATITPVLAAIALGCGPAPERVFVDLSRVDAVPASLPLQTANPPSQGASVPEMTVRMGAVPAHALTFGESADRLAAAVELVEQSRATAYEQVLRSLTESYRAEAQRWAVDRLAEVKASVDARYEPLFKTLRASFETYASQRGPLIARLAVLAGFPDPDPKSQAKVDPDKPQSARRVLEAEEIRKAVASLDAAFAERTRDLLKEAGIAGANDLARVRAEIDAAMREADRRAEEAAAAQLLRTRRDLDALLAQRTGVSLNPEPAVEVHLPASRPTAGAPALEVPTPAAGSAKEDLELWLRTRGYVLAEKGAKARDATEEFLEWRATHKAGR